MTDRPPFVCREHHWKHNRMVASAAHAVRAEMTDPEGRKHHGVALIAAGKPALVMHLDDLTRICGELLDAADQARARQTANQKERHP